MTNSNYIRNALINKVVDWTTDRSELAYEIAALCYEIHPLFLVATFRSKEMAIDDAMYSLSDEIIVGVDDEDTRYENVDPYDAVELIAEFNPELTPLWNQFIDRQRTASKLDSGQVLERTLREIVFSDEDKECTQQTDTGLCMQPLQTTGNTLVCSAHDRSK